MKSGSDKALFVNVFNADQGACHQEWVWPGGQAKQGNKIFLEHVFFGSGVEHDLHGVSGDTDDGAIVISSGFVRIGGQNRWQGAALSRSQPLFVSQADIFIIAQNVFGQDVFNQR